ncbi:hypothetical protein EON63_16970 [archaeon]|nr:MAG: hypothetical protein EON63_16970 [archaeon]
MVFTIIIPFLQVFRMAVGMANASHSLRFWHALDLDEVSRIQQLSAKYHVPFPEDFFRQA